MKYQVSLTDKINFAPGSETEEILQNIRTILTTCVGTVPLDRDLGISYEYVDKPLPVARSLMQAAVIEAIEQYEPRAKVESISFDDNAADAMDGISRPSVIVSIGDEQEDEE